LYIQQEEVESSISTFPAPLVVLSLHIGTAAFTYPIYNKEALLLLK